jgi:hypothetical protein
MGKFSAKAIYNHTAANREQLSFTKGDTLAIYRQQSDGWWEARVAANGWKIRHRVGLVPSNYLRPLDSKKLLIAGDTSLIPDTVLDALSRADGSLPSGTAHSFATGKDHGAGSALLPLPPSQKSHNTAPGGTQQWLIRKIAKKGKLWG